MTDPNVKACDALKQSKQRMKGYKLQVFAATLVGWLIFMLLPVILLLFIAKAWWLVFFLLPIVIIGAVFQRTLRVVCIRTILSVEAKSDEPSVDPLPIESL